MEKFLTIFTAKRPLGKRTLLMDFTNQSNTRNFSRPLKINKHKHVTLY